MASRSDKIIPALRLAIPVSQGPGLSEIAALSLSSSRFDQLSEQEVGLSLSPLDSRLEGAFKGLLTASPELGAFFSRVVRDQYDADQIWNTMQLYGHFRGPKESFSLGDLVQGGDKWSVVIGSRGREVTRALSLKQDNSGVWTYEVLEVRPGAKFDTIVRSWQPSAQKVLSPDSQIGAFWGPNLWRYRATLTDVPGAVALEVALDDVLAGTRYTSRSLPEFLTQIEAEFYPFAEELPLWPGSLLFTERDDEVAIVLSDPAQVLGFSRSHRSSSSAAYLELERFEPRYIWYPHP